MKRTAILLLILTLLFVKFAWAQEKAADNTKLALEKMQADKKFLIAQTMNLTETEAEAFWPIYTSYQANLLNLTERLFKVIDNYAKGYATMTDENAKELLDEYLAIERERLKSRDSYLPKFRKVLPERKVFLYYQIENKIDAGMNAMLADQVPLIE